MALVRVASAPTPAPKRGPRAAADGEPTRESAVTAGASAAAGTRPDFSFVIGGIAAVLIGLLASLIVNDRVEPTAFKPAQGISVFALLYVLAQGLERLMEPLASWVGSTESETVARDQAIARALTTGTKDDVEAAAATQARLDQKRANRAIGLWATATVLAMLGSAALGVYLLTILGAQDVPRSLEIAITGLAVAGGTKPLHDLISSLETKKNKSKDPPETTIGG
jgi:hypothetical protein